MPCRLSKTTLLFVKNYLLNIVSYAFSSRKLSFLNEKAIFSQRESIADSTKNMAFLNKKGRFSLHKNYSGCVTVSSSTNYGCTPRIGVFKSDGKKILAAPFLQRQRFSMCKRFAVIRTQSAILRQSPSRIKSSASLISSGVAVRSVRMSPVSASRVKLMSVPVFFLSCRMSSISAS